MTPDAPALSLLEHFPEAAAIGERLRSKRWTIAVAESCTGGLLCAALTAVPGASEYVRGGVVAYADDVKADQLGVSRHVLAAHGAVSEAVARAMADAARIRLGADVGVGVTGVAGPGGGTEEKPVGLIFIAATTAAGAEVTRLDDDSGREGNRSAAVRAAFELCRRLL